MVLFPDLWDDLKLRSSYMVPRFLGCRCGGLGGLGFRAYGASRPRKNAKSHGEEHGKSNGH